MKWDKDTIILIANIIITIVSGIGAYKSFRYFKKSKHITIYAQTNQALNELGEMLKMLPEALAATTNLKRGFSVENAIRDIGTRLSGHLNEIISAIPTEYSIDFQKLQKTDTFTLEQYINSYIDGTAISEENGRKTLQRASFDTCQERLRAMQAFLKQKISEEEEKLK